MSKETDTIILKEQCTDSVAKTVKVNVLSEEGKLWIGPEGYGDKTSADGHGFPISLEIWRGRLRLIVFDDINKENPRIIDLENARQTCRKRCNWCGKIINGEAVKWKSLLFCTETCLDECRAVQ